MHNFIYNHREIDYYSEKLWKERQVEPVIDSCPVKQWIIKDAFLQEYELDYGKDTLSVFYHFIGFSKGTLEEESYEENGLDGVFNFLKKVDRTIKEHQDSILSNRIESEEMLQVHQRMMEQFEAPILKNHPRAYAALLMEFSNQFYQMAVDEKMTLPLVEDYLKFLSIMAPHHAESAWQALQLGESIFASNWPVLEEQVKMTGKVEIPVQVNGKTKAELLITRDATREEALEASLAVLIKKGSFHEADLRNARFIYVEGKIINFVDTNLNP